MRAVWGYILAKSVRETGSPAAGFAWLAKLDAQTKEYVFNPILLYEKIVRQEGLITIWDLPDTLLERERGSPLQYVFPKSGTPVIDDSVGLVAGSRHAEAAKAFIDFLGSKPMQRLAAEKTYRLPARTDLGDELPGVGPRGRARHGRRGDRLAAPREGRRRVDGDLGPHDPRPGSPEGAVAR